MKQIISRLLLAVALLAAINVSLSAESTGQQLARRIDPFLRCVSGETHTYAIESQLTSAINATGRLERFNENHWRLSVVSPPWSFTLDRTADTTTLILTERSVIMMGKGEITAADTLAPTGIVERLISDASLAYPYVMTISRANAEVAATALTRLADLKPTDKTASTWTSPMVRNGSATFDDSGTSVSISLTEGTLTMRIVDAGDEALPLPPTFKTVQLGRTEMERLLVRGVRRGFEVAAPGPALTNPPNMPRFEGRGELNWQDRQRLVMIKGSPAEIGHAHGSLLREPIVRTMDSVLYLVGIGQTVNSGRWFLDDLRDAWRRLSPFIPEDHKTELAAIAAAAEVDVQALQLANVFPEMFHCSGFAVMGHATADATLYHGRILDYMTNVGLQQNAATFVIASNGKIPFITIGYAGFVGTVTAMNAKKISAGMMGGRMDRQWDGIPMATLMRRAMEECASLDDIRKLLTDSPRTCQYSYIFADGNTPAALGCDATPEKITFFQPGETHPTFGEGIDDTLLISGGNRLTTLRERITTNLGHIDEEQALALMKRPVATRINLHNVLFIPAKRMLYVAHASDDKPAADRPYVEYDFGLLLDVMP